MTHQSFDQSDVQLMNKLTGPKPLITVSVHMDMAHKSVLAQLANEKGLTESQLLVQALRLYQKMDRDRPEFKFEDDNRDY